MNEEKKTPSFAAEVIRLGLILLLITAIVAGVLGLVNALTENRIAEIAEEKAMKAKQTVLAADSYEEIAYTDPDGVVNAVWKAGENGWVVQTTTTGSQGTITMMVGVDTTGTCTGISITDSSETAGLGAVASQQSEKGEAFRNQFIGTSGQVGIASSNGSAEEVDAEAEASIPSGDIDALSGATITSKAVISGVNAAFEACLALSENGAAATTAPIETATTEIASTGSAEMAAAAAPTIPGQEGAGK